MRKRSWIFVILLGIGGVAEAQTVPEPAPRPGWEASASIALIEASPNKLDVPYYDSWYAEGRYAGAIARYWTNHLKTAYEYSVSGEASRFVQHYTTVGGVPSPYGRGGVILVQNERNTDRTDTNAGVTIGGGAKFYMTKNAFFNGGVVGTYTRPARTISFVAGFGVDF